MCLPLSSALHYLPPETAAQIVPELIEAHPEGVIEPSEIRHKPEIPLQVAMGWRAVGNSQLTPELLRVLLEAGHGYGFGGQGQLFCGPEHDVMTAMEKLFENSPRSLAKHNVNDIRLSCYTADDFPRLPYR